MAFQNGGITFVSKRQTSACSRSACAQAGVFKLALRLLIAICCFFQISYIESKNNGQNSCSLSFPFWHVCTELSMLSTNFLDSTHIYSMLKLSA